MKRTTYVKTSCYEEVLSVDKVHPQCGPYLAHREHGYAHTLPAKKSVCTDCFKNIVEAGWLGAKARSVYGAAGIGTAYSPPSPLPTHNPLPSTHSTTTQPSVETIIDISYRPDVGLLLLLRSRVNNSCV